MNTRLVAGVLKNTSSDRNMRALQEYIMEVLQLNIADIKGMDRDDLESLLREVVEWNYTVPRQEEESGDSQEGSSVRWLLSER